MYGIDLTREGGPATIQFGLQPATPFVNLRQAFEFAAIDISGGGNSFEVGKVNSAWANLTLTDDTSLSLALRQRNGDYTLIVSDAYSGSETSTGVSTLASAFDFIVRWAGEDFA